MQSGISRARLDLETEDAMVPVRRTLGVTSFGINQLNLRPGERRRIHRHQHQEEVFLVVEGTLDLLVDGEELRLEKGELVRVAPDLRRQLTNRGADRLIVLAMGGAGEHHGRDGIAFPDWDAPDAEGRPPQEVPVPPDYGAEAS